MHLVQSALFNETPSIPALNRDVAKAILETPEIERIHDRETNESIFLKLQRNRRGKN